MSSAHEPSHASDVPSPGNTSDRRAFLQAGGLSLSAAALSLNAHAEDKPSAKNDDKIVMAGIGCGGQGTNLIRSFASMGDVTLAMVCDPDERRAAAAAQQVEKLTGKAPQIVGDLRKVLENRAIQAVTVATPDHWHGPAAILACDAGKHVYVEKPCSHNIREGRLMIEAARRNKRVMQVGTQSRSSPAVIEAMKLLRDGAIGDVLVAKAWNSQRRGNIGHGTPGKPPEGLDYDMWVGPAPMVPFQANRLHYGWHWWYDFGTGDMGNDGVHDLDIARWGLGVDTHPSHVAAIGGKYVFDDDQQFPDTQYVVFEYPGDGKVGNKRQLIYEHRIWSPYRQEGYENGNAYYGSKGMMLLGKLDGWKLFGPKNKLIREEKAAGVGAPHYRNFIDSIRSGNVPNADIEIGHLSATLCHLGNLACRMGGSLVFDPAKEEIVGNPEAAALVRRKYRDGHWAVPKGVSG